MRSDDFFDYGDCGDSIEGGLGADTIYHGAGKGDIRDGFAFTNGDTLRDVFVFKSAANGHGGFDIIRDFENAIDKLDLSKSGYTSFADVLADAAQVGANVEMNLDFGGILRINDFQLEDLTAGDFLL